MHDTCNTSNKTARLGKVLRETRGQLFFGYDEWETRAEEDKPWIDFLCGNHTRNLPMDAFNKVYKNYTKPRLYSLYQHPALHQEFDAYLRRKLGEDIAALTAE